MKKPAIIYSSIALYLFSSLMSFIFFAFILGSSSVLSSPLAGWGRGNGLDIDPEEPRTEMCPLNGAMYTVAEREVWEKRRPLVLMVENSAEARPHSGLNSADVVYEAVAEGGVTRFMPVYLCGAAATDVIVAPIRSVRTYFIDWASEYGETPLFGHVGGANCSAEKLSDGNSGPCKTDKRAQALEQLTEYGWRYTKGNNLDQFSVGAQAYIRNENRLGRRVATEHSVEASTNKLWQVGADRGWTNLDPKGNDWQDDFNTWKFKDDADASKNVITISHGFWEGYKQFDVRWEYDPASNSYLRFTGGEPHLDLETGNQLTAKNVVIILTREIGPLGELKHMLYETSGRGDVLVFQDGDVIEGNWSKKERLDRTSFTTKTGDDIEFNRGLIWISVISNQTVVNY